MLTQRFKDGLKPTEPPALPAGVTYAVIQDLTGDALNWAAFLALYGPLTPTIEKLPESQMGAIAFPGGQYLSYSNGHETAIWQPDQDEAQAGRLIDQWGIASWRQADGTWCALPSACLTGETLTGSPKNALTGPTRLIACLRAAVAYVAGEPTVAVPTELISQTQERSP